jgi:serine/threonine-protein kinase
LGSCLAEGYAIRDVVGIGGTSVVYRADHSQHGPCALKVLHDELRDVTDVCARFVREGYVANSLEHPAAVPVFAHGEADDGAPYLALELLEGESLEVTWRERALPSVGRVVEIAAQLLDVLAAAHAKEIVHRDVKPGNVFVERSGRIRLLDFGLARLGTSPRLTPTGDTLGTAEFAAPEQARGASKRVDARADVYSVGALAFSLLTGSFVHAADNPMDRMVLAATREAPRLGTRLPDVDPRLARVVDTALSFRREARYADARAMLDALEELRT